MTVAVFMVDAIASHAYASIGLARRLHQQGIDVEYWGIDRNGMAAIIRKHGFVFRTLRGMWSRFADDTRVPTDLRVWNIARHLPALWRAFLVRRRRHRRLRHAIGVFERSLDAQLRACAPD